MPDGRESPRRREILEHLRAAGSPLSVAEVAERVGVHPNTVRFHLDALAADGRIEASVEPPAGPGRPRTVYAPRRGMDRGGARGYRLLARMLLSTLAGQGPEASGAATEAGRAWGRFLVEAPPPSRRLTMAEAAARLTALLDELDFAPVAEDSGADDGGRGSEDGAPRRIRLRHCPFLELAEEYRLVVCPLHLGLMQGALAGLGTPLSATRLEPFAEPDACLAHLAPV